MIKKLIRKILPNPFNRLLRQAKNKGSSSFLILWNRGLGDIPLGLYAVNYQIRKYLPNANITYLTREDLKQGFELLGNVDILTSNHIRRGSLVDVQACLANLGKSADHYDVIIEKADPTYWVSWQIGTLSPKLSWNDAWDTLSDKFHLRGKKYVGIHIDSETGQYYGYEKNWPKKYWEEFLSRLKMPIILFGNNKSTQYDYPNVLDLRGETSLHELLAILKNHVHTLVAPDSGILSIAYYVEKDFPLKIISLWSDPRQGVLKQNTPSPNKKLVHVPIISEGDISKVKPPEILRLLPQAF